MVNSQEIKLGVLEELMEKMRDLEGSKMRPKAVEVAVSSSKPMGEEGEPELEAKDLMTGKPDGMSAERGDADADGDELSPEDIAVLEQLFGDRGQDQEE
jgi:hypothetical protein